ncbi:MAG: hypothetical protein IJ826_05475 [Bacteroidaceae bacterium]|nr:hypothetical protein [Bacteroidaceae bacterium]
MRQRFYSLCLAVLLCLIGGRMAATAQVPEPTAKWTFENAEDLMAPSVGNLTLTPCVIPRNKAIETSTIDAAGIATADGPTAGSKAIYVPKASALKVCRAEGAEASTAYTIMLDFMVPNAQPFNGLLQMDEANSNDGDIFTNKNQIGIGSLKYAGNIQNNKWYRFAITYNESNPAGTQVRLYLNGAKIAEGGANQRHIMEPFGFYVLCDEDGEKIDFTYLSEIAFWETPLTDEQVFQLGRAVPPISMEISNAEDLKNFAQAVNSGENVSGVLTADITMNGTWETPIGTSENPFAGSFDGQGHKISGFNAKSDGNGGGLFGYASAATIQNFSIYGNLTVTAGTGAGVVGNPSSCVISGIHSYLEINVASSDVHHVGGVVGSSSGNNTITGCTFHGSMSVAAGSNDNFAGIMAYLGGDKVSFCANYGTISFDDPGCTAGGIAGYCNNTGSWVQNCLNMGKVSCTDPNAETNKDAAIVGWLRTHDPEKMTANCWLEGSSLYAGRDGSTIKMPTAFCFNEDQYASGEVCYNLNGDQSVIGWYQTLPADQVPVLFDSTHGQVYKNGHLHCNGDPSDNTVFSNENTGTIKDDHNVVDGYCDYCGLFFPEGLTPNADGYYEISNARRLAWFEQKVNTGTLTANAILTADIDFADLMPEGANPEETEINWVPIGDWGNTRGVNSAGYQGHFDGQGHTIKNLNTTAKQNFFGLFGVISSNSIIENFTLYGTYNTNYGHCGGVAAYARDINPTIRNVHSFVNINNTCAGARVGGILGGAYIDNINYKLTIENCSYSGILDGNDAGGGGNYGGIVGYVNNNSSNVVDITNCLFDGEVVNKNANPGGCTFGGIVGYNNGGRATICNCLSVGLVSAAENKFGQFFGALNGNNSTFVNDYYVGEFVNGASSGGKANGDIPVEVEDSQLTSGEIAWKLNGESFIDAVWRQVIDEDEYPKPTGTGAFVYAVIDGYANASEDEPESFASFRDDVIAYETAIIEDEKFVARASLVQDYSEVIGSWEAIDNYKDFFNAYLAGQKVKEAVMISAANYAAYVQACDAAAEYIKDNDLKGEYTDLLLTYLQDSVEPCSDYPNGSAPYILDNSYLNDEEIIAETALVNQMLQNAIAGGLTPGTEITRLITNPTFTEGEDKFDGWTKETGDGAIIATGGVQEIMNIAGGKNGSFDVKQTLTDLSNGVYMMALNGMFLSGQDIYSQFYAGQLYLNDTYNYFMSPGEDMIDVNAAEDKVNCLLSEDAPYLENEEPVGYVPSSFDGCSYAFEAGRYQSLTATEVTDGTLTIGMRNLGTGNAGDWMPFGNMRVYYLGTAEEANEKLADVLEDFAARAQVIVDFENSDGYDDVAMKPNISTELKGRLAEAIASVDGAATGEQKMALINTFSALFNEVYTCRKAYIAMAMTAQETDLVISDWLNLGIISEDEFDELSGKAYNAIGYFADGSVSAEQALVLADELNILDKMMPQVDGIYQISTAKQLKLFAKIVNDGDSKASAVLTSDIDFTELASDGNPEYIDLMWSPIGFWGNKQAAYRGHFDGQGHTIKNFNVIANQNYYGLFGVVSNGAVIENFSISGNFTLDSNSFNQCGGVVGFARDNSVNIRNVHSSLNINSTVNTKTIGGILGHVFNNSTVNIDRCSYSGTFTVTDDGGSDDGMYGGIVGHVYNNASAHVNITNCLFDGTILNTVAASSPVSGCVTGGIVGWIGTYIQYNINNCLSIGEVTNTCAGQIAGALQNNGASYSNNYYSGTAAFGAVAKSTNTSILVTTDQLASGEICFKLNGVQEIPAWYQNLTGDEKDLYPVLDPTHKIVLYDEILGYHNPTKDEEDGIDEIQNPSFGIQNGDAIYNLAGQRINRLQKGINIIGGKKVLY